MTNTKKEVIAKIVRISPDLTVLQLSKKKYSDLKKLFIEKAREKLPK